MFSFRKMLEMPPLKDALRANQAQQSRLESELRMARASFGVGVNGIGIGVAYAIWQVALKEHALDQELAVRTVVVMIVSGVVLELLNYFFLAKRQRVKRLTAELEEARQESHELDQKIRESSRV